MSLAQVAAAARRSAALPLTLAVAAVDIDGGGTVGVDEHTVLPVASASKLLLLAEVARRLNTGELPADRLVEVLDEDLTGGTGLLQPAERARLDRRGPGLADCLGERQHRDQRTPAPRGARVHGPARTGARARSPHAARQGP